jgi:hypothetical protein
MDPKEIMSMADNNGGGLPEIAGKRVTEDENGNICLNDLWTLAGERLKRTSKHGKRLRRVLT